MTALIGIPGRVAAYIVEGQVTEINFTPHASGAGYFGPAAVVDELSDEDEDHFDLENTEGPFWRAVQEYLAEHPDQSIGWTE